eukprot:TRINITY_DN55623_c0_g1_i1.p1 TRINITY_DN55623_c0_g1~~TRINITY_DN55623_c0_g1_i1.p1  ORF type:complete len:793 (-),score=99.86 TRINITY_DN55623_c0_g1_i1:69-2447(-)
MALAATHWRCPATSASRRLVGSPASATVAAPSPLPSARGLASRWPPVEAAAASGWMQVPSTHGTSSCSSSEGSAQPAEAHFHHPQATLSNAFAASLRRHTRTSEALLRRLKLPSNLWHAAAPRFRYFASMVDGSIAASATASASEASPSASASDSAPASTSTPALPRNSSASAFASDGTNVAADNAANAGGDDAIIVDLPAGAPQPGDLSTTGGLEELIRGSAYGLKVAKRCAGCGSWLHSNAENEHGYIPLEAREKFSPSGRKKVRKEPQGEPVDWVPDGVTVLRNESNKYRVKTKVIICKRCYRLQYYHRSNCVVQGGFYQLEGGRTWEHEAEIVEKVVRRIRKGSVVLMVVDVLDFEASMVPELYDACRQKRLPVICIVNKTDCLPHSRKDGGLNRIKTWVRRMSRQVRNMHSNDVLLVSSLTAQGFAQLEERLRHHLDPSDPKTLYVVGRVNSGKSTFVNRFLWYVGFKHQGTVDFKRTTGGVTRSPIPGTTLHFVSFPMPKGFRLVDTPGIPSRGQMSNLLTNDLDLYGALPRRKMQPISYALHSGRTLLVGAMVRIDQVKGPFSFVSSFFSPDVTLHICQTSRVEEQLERKAGDFFYPPHNREDIERMGPLVRHRVEVFGSSDRAWDDIVISGLGWVSVSGFGTKELDVWVPSGIRVFRRPALLPQQVRRHGVTRFHPHHRARGERVLRKKRGAVKTRRDSEMKAKLREATAEAEAGRSAPIDFDDDVPFVVPEVELPQGYVLASGGGSSSTTAATATSSAAIGSVGDASATTEIAAVPAAAGDRA